jgi:hypothetical protein
MINEIDRFHIIGGVEVSADCVSLGFSFPDISQDNIAVVLGIVAMAAPDGSVGCGDVGHWLVGGWTWWKVYQMGERVA